LERVAILGLGLMGGSLGAALKARGFAGTVTAFARREATRAQALARGFVDAVYEQPAGAVEGADTVVCCVPILSIPAVIAGCRGGLRPGCVVTDVGSTKQALIGPVAQALAGSGAHFVGSHPIAGSERQGIEAASPDLYQGATVVITPDRPEAEGLDAVRRLWAAVGAHGVVMEPGRHDRLLARTSHLPHLAASALALTVGRGGNAGAAAPFCGTGFRDTTRVAEGSPDVWLDIVRTNRLEVVRELKAYRGEIENLMRHLEAEDFDAVYAFLEQGKTLREMLAAGTVGRQP
jgi:prephenate dehydrogenase